MVHSCLHRPHVANFGHESVSCTTFVVTCISQAPLRWSFVLNFADCLAGGLHVNSTSTGVNSSSSDQIPVSDLRRLWAMVSKPDFGQPADSPDEVRTVSVYRLGTVRTLHNHWESTIPVLADQQHSCMLCGAVAELVACHCAATGGGADWQPQARHREPAAGNVGRDDSRTAPQLPHRLPVCRAAEGAGERQPRLQVQPRCFREVIQGGTYATWPEPRHGDSGMGAPCCSVLLESTALSAGRGSCLTGCGACRRTTRWRGCATRTRTPP